MPLPTREEAELQKLQAEAQKLQMECQALELNNEMLRNKLNPQLYNANAFAKTVQFVLTYATGASGALGSACVAIASVMYANGVTSQYCQDLSNINYRTSCNTGSAGFGFFVAAVGFYGMGKLLNKFNTHTSDESPTKIKKLN